jgi:hypothetical protein
VVWRCNNFYYCHGLYACGVSFSSLVWCDVIAAISLFQGEGWNLFLSSKKTKNAMSLERNKIVSCFGNVRNNFLNKHHQFDLKRIYELS